VHSILDKDHPVLPCLLFEDRNIIKIQSYITREIE